MLIALNAADISQTIRAFDFKYLRNRFHSEENSNTYTIQQELLRKNITAKDILDQLLKAHPVLEKYLCSGVGIKLQNIDSNISNDLLAHFTKQGNPVLCIHDSYIIKERFRDELEDKMHETYRQYLNGFDCTVK